MDRNYYTNNIQNGYMKQPPMPTVSPPPKPPPPPIDNSTPIIPQTPVYPLTTNRTPSNSFLNVPPPFSMYLPPPGYSQHQTGMMPMVPRTPPPNMNRLRPPWSNMSVGSTCGPPVRRQRPWMSMSRKSSGNRSTPNESGSNSETCDIEDSPKRKSKRSKRSKKSEDHSENAEDEVEYRAKKRRPLAFKRTKMWNRADAVKALQAEMEVRDRKESRMLMITFPDPPITCQMVEDLDPAISKPHFQLPSGPRYCFFQVKEGHDIDEVVKRLNEVNFMNMGKLSVRRKSSNTPVESHSPEQIDPYTLYLGNLPLTITTSAVKEKFSTAVRVDIGYAQKLKYTRYAFILYQTVEDAIEALKKSADISFDSRTCVLRFRRQRAQMTAENANSGQLKTLSNDQMKELRRMERMEPLNSSAGNLGEAKKFNVMTLMQNDNENCTAVTKKQDDEEKEVDDDVDENEDDDDDIDLSVNSKLLKKPDSDDSDTNNVDEEEEDRRITDYKNVKIKKEPGLEVETVVKTEPDDTYYEEEEKEVDDEIIENESD